MTASVADRRIRGLRGPKPRVDPWKSHGTIIDIERRPDGRTERALTIFLAGAECPFTCSFCDLWRWTIEGPTPRGALPAQIADALRDLASPFPDRIKLYNASNFFDHRAVPPDDLPEIAALTTKFAGLTVESHVSTIGPAALEFAERISGRLEVAIGLETVHPVAVANLNKRLDLEQFDQSVRLLSDAGVDVRVFVLLGAPFVPTEESVEWTVRSAEYAMQRGAAVVSLIPVRGGNGELERVAALGQFVPPTLEQLEASLDHCLGFTTAVVTADLWDAERLSACASCRTAHIERIRRINVTGQPAPRVGCGVCSRS